MISITILKKLS